ncbi:nuclear transport factor 2 family protein [Nocardioides alkalitolerans]|uniref:nuclear transport factor 2 family protein n=1 Tax=Nocardioides alkalitolerans TaxID=281714 RepID=UPI000402067B|nr:nuclear transport factor 2 family protein [Nocardioides alkalitolerans]
MTIDELLDREAIREAMAQYARGIDRQDADLVRDAYWPEGWDAHGSHEGTPAQFVEFVQANWPLFRMQHVFGQHHIELAGTRANVETQFVAHHRLLEQGIEYVLGGRYNDRFEKRGNVWRVLHRVVVFDWRRQWSSAEGDEEKMSALPDRNRGGTANDYSWELFRSAPDASTGPWA